MFFWIVQEERLTKCLAHKLDYLISLKQQQVTVVQAWQSMKQGEDNQRQNVTLLVFTVVTVIFVRLSFSLPHDFQLLQLTMLVCDLSVAHVLHIKCLWDE